jgi:hypothetical protein
MNIPFAHVIDYADGGRRLAAGVSDDRAVLTDAARSALPAGTITIDADECSAMAVGDGTFLDAGLSGSFPGSQSVILPAYIVAGPGLPVHIPGGSAVLVEQESVDFADVDLLAVDLEGVLFRWEFAADGSGYGWEKAGRRGRSEGPVFPVTAWRI